MVAYLLVLPGSHEIPNIVLQVELTQPVMSNFIAELVLAEYDSLVEIIWSPPFENKRIE